VKYPPGISKFLDFGELYAPTMAATDQQWTWGMLHIQGDVKLHILAGGGINPGGSWVFVTGVWEFPIGISKFLAGKPTLDGNDGPHRLAMDMPVSAY
jgi:hypothetical protein